MTGDHAVKRAAVAYIRELDFVSKSRVKQKITKKNLVMNKSLALVSHNIPERLFKWQNVMGFCYILYKSMSCLVKSIDLINFGAEVFKCIYFI